MSNKVYLETEKNVESFGRLFNKKGPSDLPIPEGSNVYLEGSSLVIPEQPQPLPEPVIEIDGVVYYHKQEFDLTDLGFNESKYDVITGKKFANASQIPYVPYIYSYYHGSQDVDLILRTSGGPSQYKRLYSNGSSVTYESQAFVVTEDVSEVTSEGNRIYFGSDEYEIAAYYGWLSEDGKTFISYYNLQNEHPDYIDSVKQGENEIEMHDPRLEGEIATVDTRITEEIARVIAMIPEIPEIPETLPVINVTMTYVPSRSCTFKTPDSGTLLLAKDSSRGFIGIIVRSIAFSDRFSYRFYQFNGGSNKIDILGENSGTTHVTGETATLTLQAAFRPLFNHTLSFTKDSTTYKLATINNYDGTIGIYTHGTPKFMLGLYYIGHDSETNILSPVRIKPSESDVLFVFQDENDTDVTLSFANDFSGDTVTDYIY